MRKKVIIMSLALGSLLLVGASCDKTETSTLPLGNENAISADVNAQATTVTIQNSAFSPETITVRKGVTVTWVNKDSLAHQVASDPHPSHTDLPGLQSTLLSPGQQYGFTFTEVGNFGYHCHLHPEMQGRVIVEQ